MQENVLQKKECYHGTPALLLFVAAAGTILCNASASAEGALSGLKLCANIIIPALFPFTVVAIFFEKSGALGWLGEKLEPVFRFCFGISGSGGAALILSLLGGYPVGAKLLDSLYRSGSITKKEAMFLLRFAINPSPTFFLSFVGEALLQNRQAGIILLVSNLLACLMLTSCFGKQQKNEKKSLISDRKFTHSHRALSDAFVESVADASSVIVSITAWVTLFSCVLGLLTPLLPKRIFTTLSPILEITVGLVTVSKAGLTTYLYAPLLSFGGFSTVCQVKHAAGALKPSFAFLVCHRLLHGIVAALFSVILFYLYPCTISVWSNTNAPTFTTPDMLPASVAFLIMAVVFLVYLKPDKTRKMP